MLAMDLDIRILVPDELDQAFKLESDGYPADEGASLESLQFRQREAPQLFLGAFDGDHLLAFICSTRYIGPRMREESMSNHEPDAPYVCVHSVCVRRDKRRKGLALRLLSAYNTQVAKTQTGAVKMMLICKAGLIPLYTKAGYTLVGESSIVHGRDKWYEMERFI